MRESGRAPVSSRTPARPRILVLARNFPNPAFPTLGLWTERLVQAAGLVADSTVIAPVPWGPPFLPLETARRFRRVPRRLVRQHVEVHYPKVLLPPGYRLHALEARLQYPWVRRVADRIRREFPFDLIHAHFIFPEGVMASRLGQRYAVPVVTTEHALWQPWLERWPAARKQVLAALPGIARVTAVSEAVRGTIEAIAGKRARISLLPNVVDETVFHAPGAAERWDPDQILFVGAVRYVKGLDVLLRAMAWLTPVRPSLRLLVLGEAVYGQWRRDELAVQELCRELGLNDRVRFAGRASPDAVAAAMRASAALVVPGRRESFSAVAIEALASGTPVVATRCGGPEEILTGETGVLVDPDDPEALGRGIDAVLRARAQYEPGSLRHVAVSRFGMNATAQRLRALYSEVLAEGQVLNAR